jgi:AcrR family transcriptional regulator
MRVTAETRQTTRRKILKCAEAQFRSAGFEATTTRDIAAAAGIATGTLFNYFPTKEAIVGSMLLESQTTVSCSDVKTLEEALFAHAAITLRRLKNFRKFLLPVLETTLSPLARTSPDEVGQVFRTAHLEAVCHLAKPYVDPSLLTPVALQMYWTLYLGVLSFWNGDTSPKQEDTLALLDESMAMFSGWLLRDQSSST